MKRALLLIILSVGLLSCDKENDGTGVGITADTPMTFNISVSETHAAKGHWEKGDVIYVFFKGLSKYLVLSYDGSSWSNTPGAGAFVATDFDAVSKTLTAVHFPTEVDVTYADKEFSFSKDGKPVYNYYLSETDVAYTVDGATVSAGLALVTPESIAQFHVAGIEGAVADYTFGSAQLQPVACASVSTAGIISEEVLQAGARMSGTAYNNGAIFSGHLTTTGSADYTFTLACNDKIYTLKCPGQVLERGKTYTLPALSESDWSTQDASELYVDLGLTSGLKWARRNIGAVNATDYGDHFAWGELQPKETYSWGTCFDTSDGGSNSEKYALDKKTVLELADDAAYAALGGNFRMPTYEDWVELKEECTWEWKSTDDGYSVNGYLVTSKNNSTSIFLPVAGYRKDSSLLNTGAIGYYWSSSLSTSNSNGARYMIFNSVIFGLNGGYRYYGHSVRPVSE